MLALVSRITDLLIIACGGFAAQALVFGNGVSLPPVDGLFALLALMLALLLFRLFGVYRAPSVDSATLAATRTLGGWMIAQLAVGALSESYPDAGPRGDWLVSWTVATGLLLVAGKYAAYAVVRLLRRRGYGRVAVAIVASAAGDRPLIERIASRRDSAWALELIFDASHGRDTLVAGLPVVHHLESFTQLVRAHRIKELWIVDGRLQQVSVKDVLDAFRDDFVNIRIVPALAGRTLPEPAIVDCLGLPVLNLVVAPERGLRSLPKAAFDRLFALGALLALAPLLIAIAVAVKCSSPGPVLFRQQRKGMNGEAFSIYKFRTMYQGADRPGSVTQARKGDVRITRLGRILRRTSLDELPQFLNVLKGDMSVVGPRPHAVEHDEYYKELVQHYMYRYRIKPGITGWAQVNGYRGETERIEKMAARVMFDIHYIQHWTLWLDLKIVYLTITKGLVGNSAY
ncbi:MAG TPA: undecaprenyl-phosphate glucose phosphotransferase [Paraburkholderia sp.]